MHLDAKLVARYVFRETLSLVVMGAALFWAAGRLDWGPAWAALGISLAWLVATGIVVIVIHPGLIAERLGSPVKGAKRWDAVIVSLLGMLQLLRYILAGLDERYGWTGGFPVWVQFAAAAVCVAGHALFTWATASNPFFTRFVRIQHDRGHAVVSSGPYRYLRHPAYFGVIMFELAVSVLLASWAALAVSVLNTLLLVVRTALEDRALLAELNGYTDYARRVHYRLFPGLW